MSSKQARQGFQRVWVMWRCPQYTQRVTTGFATFLQERSGAGGMGAMALNASMTFADPNG